MKKRFILINKKNKKSILLYYFEFLEVLAVSVICFLMPLSVSFLETQGLRWLDGGAIAPAD